jgi:hypothetical protein
MILGKKIAPVFWGFDGEGRSRRDQILERALVALFAIVSRMGEHFSMSMGWKFQTKRTKMAAPTLVK